MALVVLLAALLLLNLCVLRGWAADTRDPVFSVGPLLRAGRALRDFAAVQVELQERLVLANRPWEQEFLHWADGELHGRVTPPADGRQRSVTSAGWCPCPRTAGVHGRRSA